jgi:hypothetical protein
MSSRIACTYTLLFLFVFASCIIFLFFPPYLSLSLGLLYSCMAVFIFVNVYLSVYLAINLFINLAVSLTDYLIPSFPRRLMSWLRIDFKENLFRPFKLSMRGKPHLILHLDPREPEVLEMLTKLLESEQVRPQNGFAPCVPISACIYNIILQM